MGHPQSTGESGGSRRGFGPAARGRALLLALVAGLVAGCATAPVHPALRAAPLPGVIPLRAFFANTETQFNYRISPDGTRLAWIAVDGRRLTVWVRTVGRDDARALDTRSRRSVFSFTWAADSRRLVFAQDRDGDENDHLYLIDVAAPGARPVDLTPFPGVKAYVQRVVQSDPEHILIAHNARDRAVFDLFRVDLATREQTEIARNPGNVTAWSTGVDGTLRGRFRKTAPDETRLEVIRAGQWSPVATLGLEDSLRIHGYTRDGGMWVTSNRGRDRIALTRLDVATARERMAWEHPTVDVERVVMSELRGEPLLAAAFPDYQHVHVFDHTLAEQLRALISAGPASVNVLSMDRSERRLTVQLSSDRGVEYHLLDRSTGETTLLGRHPIHPHADALAAVRPVAFPSRDGLTLRGYLTRPAAGGAGRVPMVLLVHGGPWARDYWGYLNTVQFLANRGYAVLQVNYRGSTGYGRAFREAAVHQHAGRMHDDLIDGVRWAIAEGIADPEKICISGASYGGYATLVGLAFTPGVFACGVDLVGMSSLVTVLERAPAYWKLSLPYFHKYYGNPANPDDRRRLEAQSPIHRAAEVIRPLLVIHGANDVRVDREESERMVEALRRAGKDVEYLEFTDEGHTRDFGNWRNSVRLYRAMERFLARHLGGRTSGFDYVDLAAMLNF
jgi:dipeptidyl aminopeptidase/acylaminoacyl peptidase